MSLDGKAREHQIRKNEPRPYDLANDNAEFDRLMREAAGYLRVSLEDGTDRAGRRYALEGLEWVRAHCSFEFSHPASKSRLVFIQQGAAPSGIQAMPVNQAPGAQKGLPVPAKPTDRPKPRYGYVDCAECTRGGNGTAKSICAYGGRITTPHRHSCNEGKLLRGLQFKKVEAGR